MVTVRLDFSYFSFKIKCSTKMLIHSGTMEVILFSRKQFKFAIDLVLISNKYLLFIF